MPEIWLFGLIFLLIFGLFWTVIEIGIKWLVLENILVWKNVWLSLLNSVFIQLFQILGAVLAFFLSTQILEKWIAFSGNSESSLLFIATFIFVKLITDTTISGLFLTVVKKPPEQAWRASLISSFIGIFFLCMVVVLISSL